MKTSIIVLLGSMVLCIGGCQQEKASEPAKVLEAERELRQENDALRLEAERLGGENESLRKQIEVLAGLGEDVRLSNLTTLREVSIHRRTGFYDKDRDGVKEKLIVYVEPIDEVGDIVKVAGSVEVKLFYLEAEDAEVLLERFDIGPEQLKKLWSGTLMTSGYRLSFDKPATVTDEMEELLVRVSFTEYLTGKVFRAARVIKQ
ncbi:MAG: hypothetical protein ABIG61_08180 [Planctomycetota bacterium]